jgi:hypothetical protein
MDRALSDQTAPRMSKTFPFSVRHPFLVHGTIVLLCWSAYGFDRVDVVWRLIRSSAEARVLEHAGFGLAALLIGLGVWFGAWPSGNQVQWAAGDARAIRRRSLGEILHAAGIATLLPVGGAVALIVAEIIRSKSFARARISEIPGKSAAPAAIAAPTGSTTEPPTGLPRHRRFFVRHMAGFCAFFSMLVFSITLRDRLADLLFAVTAVVFTVSRFINVL